MKATTATKDITPGEVFEAQYPFVRDTWIERDEDEEGRGSTEVPTWKPGTRYEQVPPEGRTVTLADGLGRVVLTVVSLHKPGPFPTRVFFTRSWVTPDGKAFGKRKCRVTTVQTFRTLALGYRHDYKLEGCDCYGCAWPFEDHRKGGDATPPDAPRPAS